MMLLLNILCWSWMLLGIWWFFRPAGIKRRLEKGFRKKMRWILFVVFFAVAGVVFQVGRGIPGILGWILILVACIALLKGLLLVRGRVSDQVLDWWSKQPVSVYRMAAAGLFALGCIMQWLMHFRAS